MSDVKDVYTIQNAGERNFWIKLGVAFVNQDGSLNVKLDGLPVNGSLHIRDRKPREAKSEGGAESIVEPLV